MNLNLMHKVGYVKTRSVELASQELLEEAGQRVLEGWVKIRPKGRKKYVNKSLIPKGLLL